MAHDDESEDIEDLGTAGDLIDGMEKMLAGLRHLLGDVEDHEREEQGGQEALSAGGTEVILPLSGPPAMESVFKVNESSDNDAKKALEKLIGPGAQVRVGRDSRNPNKNSTLYGADEKTDDRYSWDGNVWHPIGTGSPPKNKESLVREETSEDWLEENPTCTPQVAKRLLDQHGLGWFDFVADNPDQRSAQRVDSRKLLAWMGY